MHRDLKPENILLDSKHGYNVKLIDFGTSATLDKHNKMTNTYGTAYYIAPEVILSNYTEKCDLWSVGVILYILLAGKPPFDGNNDKEIIKKVRLGVFDLNAPELEEVSPEGKLMIKQLLTTDPNRRMSADEALAHPWIAKFEKPDSNKEATALALVNL